MYRVGSQEDGKAFGSQDGQTTFGTQEHRQALDQGLDPRPDPRCDRGQAHPKPQPLAACPRQEQKVAAVPQSRQLAAEPPCAPALPLSQPGFSSPANPSVPCSVPSWAGGGQPCSPRSQNAEVCGNTSTGILSMFQALVGIPAFPFSRRERLCPGQRSQRSAKGGQRLWVIH